MKLKKSEDVKLEGSAKNHMQKEQIKAEIKQALYAIPSYEKLVDDFFIVKSVCNKIEQYDVKIKQLKVSKKQIALEILREVFVETDAIKVSSLIDNLVLNGDIAKISNVSKGLSFLKDRIPSFLK